MRLTILGSGSPEPYARRASSGYLLEIGNEKLLFDCGGGVVSRLIEAGHGPGDIDYVFFSHLHSDHMLDYARLVHASWEMNGKPLKVFGPAPLYHIHDRLFAKDGALAHDLRARIEYPPSQEVWRKRGGKVPRPWPSPDVTEVEPGFTVETDNWRLSSCAVPHAEPYLVSMALRIDTQERSFVYSGDAGICGELKLLAAGAHTLLHWCYRPDGEDVSDLMEQMTPTPSEISKMAKSAGVERLLLTHFRVHMDRKHIQNAKEALRQDFGDNGRVVEDLNVFEF